MKTRHGHTTLPKEADSSPTVGDIFRKHGRAHRLHPRQHKVMYDIEHCRCGDFGTHWEICDTCGHLEKGYNSCRNRHCPGCNNIARRRWVEARVKDLLPVSYHHCVFTLPGMFNALCRFNRRIMYRTGDTLSPPRGILIPPGIPVPRGMVNKEPRARSTP